MRQHEEGEAADRRSPRLEGAEGAAQRRGDTADPSLRALPTDLPVYSASPDYGDDGSSGVWPSVGADAILIEDAQYLANIADVSADKIQRELGVVSRTREGDIKRNEIQMAEVLRDNGSVRAGPPVSNKYHRQKEEEAWLHTSTIGTRSRMPSSLMEGLTRMTPHFGHAPVARVEGTVASPLLLSRRMCLSRVASNGSKTELTRRSGRSMTSGASRVSPAWMSRVRETTSDMSRSPEEGIA